MINRCPVCANTNITPFQWESPELPLRTCRECGLVFLSSPPPASHLQHIYENGYYAHWQGEWQTVWDNKLRSSRRILDKVAPYVLAPSGTPSLLDVGCAHGFFLEAARERGFKTSGVEIAPDAVAYAKDRGLEVLQGTILDAPFADASLDVITAIDVIEHLPDPMAFADSVRRLLVPGGLMVLVTPDISNWTAWLMRGRWPHYKSEHVLYYSPRSIRKLCELGGFKILSVSTSTRYLTLNYVRGHFEKFSKGILRKFVLLSSRLLPRLLRELPLRFPTEMLVIARRELDPTARGSEG